jgi:hypothetical protein
VKNGTVESFAQNFELSFQHLGVVVLEVFQQHVNNDGNARIGKLNPI